MTMAVSTNGRKREEYMARWPQTKQNEAVCDQLRAISDALRSAGVPLVDAPKFTQMLEDFAAVRTEVEGEA